MRFSHHAGERLTERGVTRADAERVVNDPAATTTVRPGATNYHGRVDDGRAIVVVVADDMPDLIITVMLDDREDQP